MAHWSPKKKKSDPKIKSKSKVKIEENIENKSCSTIWVDQETVFESYNDPKNSQLWPQKVKKEPKKNWVKIKSQNWKICRK